VAVRALFLDATVLAVDDDPAFLAFRDLASTLEGFLLGGCDGASAVRAFAADSPAVLMGDDMVTVTVRHVFLLKLLTVPTRSLLHMYKEGNLRMREIPSFGIRSRDRDHLHC
jgi:hypothetical protein